MRLCLPKSHVVIFCKFFVNQDLGLGKKLCKLLSFLYLLTHGRHLTNFENMCTLFEFLKIKHCTKNIGVQILIGD
jgi:hypothetical protein